MKVFDLVYEMGLEKVLAGLITTLYVTGSFSRRVDEQRLLSPESSHTVLGMMHFPMDMCVPIKAGL